MRWPAWISSPRQEFTPRFAIEPCKIGSGSLRYRHYYISGHAIDRYIQREGGCPDDLLNDLRNSWVFDVTSQNLPRKYCSLVAKLERDDGYALTNGRVIFLVRPQRYHHSIVTILVME